MQWNFDAQERGVAETQSPENLAGARDRLVAGVVLTGTEEDWTVCLVVQEFSSGRSYLGPRNVRETEDHGVVSSLCVCRDRVQRSLLGQETLATLWNQHQTSDTFSLSKTPPFFFKSRVIYT